MQLPSFIFNANTMTPEQLARNRALAEAMLNRGQTGVASNVGEGLAQLGQALGGRLRLSGIDKAMRAGQDRAYTGMANAYGGAPAAAPVAAPVVAGGAGGGGGGGASWLEYANQGATRNKPISSSLEKSMSFLPGMGVTMKVFSGGQDAYGTPGGRRTGSKRHDHGNSADVFFYKDGRKLDWANPNDMPIFQEIVRRGKAAGVTGWGAGEGYMQPGSMHLGFGSPSVWGAGGKGANAPGWLRTAFNGGDIRAVPMPDSGLGRAPQAIASARMPDLAAGLPKPAIKAVPMPDPLRGQTPILPTTQQAPQIAAAPSQTPQIVPTAGPAPQSPQMAPQAPLSAYQRMMAGSLGKEAGGLAAPPNRAQMASVMGNAGPARSPFAPQSANLPISAIPPQNGSSPADMPVAPQQSRSAGLRSFIGSSDFAHLEPTQQQMVIADYNRALEAEQPDPNDALDRRYKEAQIAKLQADIAESQNPDARKRLGLNPIYGKRGEKLIIMQPSETGGLVEAELPEGVTLEPGTGKIDLGTEWGITDRSGSIIQRIPKDVAGEAAGKALGTARGEAISQAPAAKIGAEQTIAKIDEILADPNLSSISGAESYLPDPMLGMYTGGKGLDLRRRVEQLQGSAFLEAYNGLKGGGQITEVEGKKAENALARLNTAQTDAGYRQALVDFRDAVAQGYQKLAAKTNGNAPALNVGPRQPESPSPAPVQQGTPNQGGPSYKEGDILRNAAGQQVILRNNVWVPYDGQ